MLFSETFSIKRKYFHKKFPIEESRNFFIFYYYYCYTFAHFMSQHIYLSILLYHVLMFWTFIRSLPNIVKKNLFFFLIFSYNTSTLPLDQLLNISLYMWLIQFLFLCKSTIIIVYIKRFHTYNEWIPI